MLLNHINTLCVSPQTKAFYFQMVWTPGQYSPFTSTQTNTIAPLNIHKHLFGLGERGNECDANQESEGVKEGELGEESLSKTYLDLEMP